MSEMEIRGHILLDKWLSGEISYLEELELFELAEQDEMLKDALEGYLAQDIVIPAAITPVEAQLNTKQSNVTTLTKRGIFARWQAIAAVLVVALVATLYIFQTKDKGLEGTHFTIADDTFNANPTLIEKKEIVTEELVDDSKLVVEVQTPKTLKKELPQKVEVVLAEVKTSDVKEEEVIAEKVEPMPIANIEKVESVVKTQDLEIVVSELDPSDLASEMIVDDEGNIIPKGMTEEEVAYFKSNEDDLQFQTDVRKSAIKDANRDQPITAYEIDVKSGVDPTKMNQEYSNKDSFIAANHNPLMVIADGNQSEVTTVQNKSDVVIKEYQISKVDILNPPIVDYNSMVRSKYKRKGSPTIGYLKYKHVLKESVSCLIDTYKNVEYLEEVLIKFRIHKSGDIEFLELFGVNNEQCIDAVSKAITEGPTWELKDYYESIDVEVPFKVLYPYLF